MRYTIEPLTGKEYIQIAEHYYAVRDEWFQLTKEEQHLEMCVCAAKHRKHLMFTGESARVIRRIPRLGDPEVKPHCLSDIRKTSDEVIYWHYGPLDPNASIICDLLVVSEVQMICDLATSDTPESLLVSINHCLNKNLFTKEQLLSAIDARPYMKGGVMLKRLLRFATSKCESPLETIAMLAIYKAGLTMPQQQVVIRDNKRAFIGCVDMYWEISKRKIVLEMDGQSKYRNDKDGKVQFTEKVREDKLREQGYEVVRSIWSEVMNGKLVQKLIDKNIPSRRFSKREFPS
ncbi:MAG: hypothetical protein LBN12_07560 [Clostridiales Family XIII bacterium]|jgi:very-short-patch-repair endonuclease|nr:hypothetical protein [Clostridiales Family XIII bacterium]